MRNLKWLSLNDVKRALPAMDRLGVSKVARGIEPSSQTNEGWVQAYIATGGKPVAMGKRLTGRNDHETWTDRRKQFLARHLEKVRRDNEPLWRNGEPTRRHLALVAWGYSPTISKLQTWLKTQPSLSSEEWKKAVRILKRNPKTPTKSQSELYFENYDLYSDRDPSDTIPIQYSTMDELKTTIKKLEKLYKSNQYSHARIVQVANVLKQRLRVIYQNTGKAKDRYDLATDYFTFLTSQRTPLDKMKRKSLNFSIHRKNGAPGYQSYGWTTQDWRSIFLHSDGSVSYDKKCGAKGTKLPSGKPRLCLPVYVIKQLLKTKGGKKILIQQARKKQRAKKGQRIPWHPKIKELHSKLEARTPADDPKLKRKNPNTISQFFIDREMPSVMVDDTLIVQCDDNSLALLQDYSDFLCIDVHPMIDDQHIHIHSEDWDTTFVNLHQLFD